MAQNRISMTVRVLHVVTAATEPMKAYDVARKLGCSCNAVRVMLSRLTDSGKIQRVLLPDHGVGFTVERESGPHIWDITMRWMR
jgi:predicted ArsR family transcriptional regulator